ncbi:MAG: hypothetical protein EPO07_05460 [Verrucomicrobia bacterium]|nr:MAG: hypothetical protein EPO07_05460 [Verrucomicrobiota bacterium]
MKKLMILTTAAVTVIAFTGCETPEGYPDRTATGALTGGAIGAASGALIAGGHHGVEGALIGGAIGAVTGGLIGQSMDAEHRARLREQAPQTYQRIDQGQPLGLADVKALSRAGLSDDVIISQIRNTHTSYHLSSGDIIELHDAGVSQKVIEFMINTSGTSSAAPGSSEVVYVDSAPPPPPAETIVVAPGPGYVWIGGEWEWRNRWVWVGGRWAAPPRPGVVWVGGYWSRGPRGYVRVHGHWR